MSDETASLYAEITEDVEMSAYQVWATVRESVRAQGDVVADVRAGQDGLFWRGSLVGVMEDLWPQIGGAVRANKEVNRVRLSVHTWLTRRGLLHCDKRGGGSGGSVSLWWVNAEWNPSPSAASSAKWADPSAVEPEPDPEPEETYLDSGDNDDVLRMRQMLAVILAAQDAGAPLTTTALSQIPTGVALEHRKALLARLAECGAVEYTDMRVPSGHTIGVWVGVSDVPPWLSMDGMPGGYTVLDVSAADVLEQWLADYRALDSELREAHKMLDADEARDAELSSLREQLSVIKKALSR